MNRSLLRAVILLPVLILVTAGAIIVSADAWLESSSGRLAVETALSRNIGMPVRLAGEFSLDVIPPVGVSGTDLMIGESPDSGVFASSHHFKVALELLPLWRKELKIISLHLANGTMDPSLYVKKAAVENPGQSSTSEPGALPVISKLTLEDFHLRTHPGQDKGVTIRKLQLEEFSENHPAPFTLDAVLTSGAVEVLQIGVTGKFALINRGSRLDFDFDELGLQYKDLEFTGSHGKTQWHTESHLLESRMELTEASLGMMEVNAAIYMPSAAIAGEGDIALETLHGTLAGGFARPGVNGRLEFNTTFSLRQEGWLITSLSLAVDDYSISGNGCILTADGWSFQLLLDSELIDLDRLREFLPPERNKLAGPGPEVNADIDIEMTINEARMSGASGRGVVLRAGDRPDCSQFSG